MSGRRGAVLALALAAATACRRGGGEAPKEAPAVALAPENVATVEEREIRSGPEISGTLRAQREAMLRAEVGGSVVAVLADGGQRVRAGQPLARIQAAALQDQVTAARTGVASAQNGLKVAMAEAERARTLAEAGAMAPRDAERADAGLEAARAQVAEAQARLAAAQEQTSRTAVKAPFDGVVSARQVSVGDVVAPGTALFTVIDPGRLQFDASVPAARLGEAKVDAPVDFRVTGFGERTFAGHIERVNPSVDPATGQVRVYVDVPNERGELLAGLYAFGRIAAETRRLPVAPDGAVDASTDPPTVLRVQGGKVARTPVTVAVRDEMGGVVGFGAGVKAGDVLVVGPARSTLADGAAVRVEGARGTSPGSGATAADGAERR
jgi:RND family efflux transporter MFP subunit